jgi:FkbH-like protein
VFVDDSEYELGLVNAFLPEVDTVKADYSNLSFIDEIKSFFGHAQSSDLNRTKLYKEQKEREKEKLMFKTVEEYNASLETKYICDFAAKEHLDRVSELSQRTNQFNMSGKRYSKNDPCVVLYLSASDKYGDMGIVGAAMIKNAETAVVIENFMLSCRVFDRGFEYILLDKIKELSHGKNLYGVYVQTEKNQRYAGFYAENGVLLYE